MKLLHVKGNIAKITYNPTENHILPADFLLIEDSNQKLIAQIINISTTEDININIADVRLILAIDAKDNLSFYNGYIPLKTASVVYIKSDEIAELIQSSDDNIYIGNLSNHNDCFVKIPLSALNDRLYIQSDRNDKIKIFIQNLITELTAKNKKMVILDFDGHYNTMSNAPRIKITESFKLPLNAEAFNNILEYDTKDCPIEDKAVIQSIVLELREYIKTVDNKFLPFTLFKTVVDNEFASNPISGLMLLRNKLWMYAQENLFAESKTDFQIANTILDNQNILIIDASAIDEKWYKFATQAIQTIINKPCYFVMSLNDIDTDKKTISSLYNNPDIIPIINTNFDSKYRQILKSLCKNQVLFKPSKLISDDEAYDTFINRINSSEFIFYGESSLNIPLVIELQSFDASTKDSVEQNEITKEVDKFLNSSKNIIPQQHPVKETFLKEDIIKDNYESKNVIPSDEDFISNDILNDDIDDDFNDSDLDFLDSQNKDSVSIEDLKKIKVTETAKDNSYDVFAPLEENADVELIKNDDNNSEELHIIDNIDETDSDLITVDSISSETELLDISDDLFSDIPEQDDIINSDNTEIQTIADDNQSEEDLFIEVEHNSVTDISDSLEDDLIFDSAETETVTNIDVSHEENDILVDLQTETEEIVKPIGAYVKPMGASDDENETSENIDNVQNIDEKAESLSETEEIIKPMGVSTEDSKSVDDTVNQAQIPDNDEIFEIKETPDDIDTESELQEPAKEDIVDADEDDTKQENNDEEIASIDDVINDIEDKASKDELPQAQESDEAEEQGQLPDAPPVNKNIKEKKSPALPYYEAEIEAEENKVDFKIGDKVYHPKHGNGVILGFAQYKNTMYCRIEFEGEGFRILDPRVSALEKI